MGRNFMFGDLHGGQDGEFKYLTKKVFIEQKDLTSDDVVFFLGDFGLPWFYDPHGDDLKKERKAFNSLLPTSYTIFVIPGNHENYHLINDLPIIDKWGGRVYVYEYNGSFIYYAVRGEVYFINGKMIFTFSGALSGNLNEKVLRKDLVNKYKVLPKFRYGEFIGNRPKKIKLRHVDYWEEELFTEEERLRALDNLASVNNNVDLILTHTCALSIVSTMLKTSGRDVDNKLNDPVALFLEELKKIITFKEWHFGHLHFKYKIDEDGRKYFCHYKTSPVEVF